MGQSAPLGKKLALIVDNDTGQRELIGALLEELDIDVVGCESAEAALSVLALCSPQVVLLFADVCLPGVRDGLDLAGEVARRWPDIRIILSSGYAPPGPVPEGVTFLAKPWRALDLLICADPMRN